MSNRPTLTLKKRSRAADPAPAPKVDPDPAPAAAEPAPEPKKPRRPTWKPTWAMAARMRALGVGSGFVGAVVTSAVRNRERKAAGECEDLAICAVPAGTGDRLRRAADAAGMESPSEWAAAVLLDALAAAEPGDAA